MNLYDYAFQVSVSIVIFAVLVLIGIFLVGIFKNTSFKYLNPLEYLPEEEVKNLKQFYYLLMVLLLFFIVVNFFFDNDIILSNSPKFYVFHSILDILLSVYIVSIIYEKSYKNLLLVFFIIPIPSIAFLLFGESLIEYWDFVRIPAFLYLFKYFYGKFKDYTTQNRLNFSIILLFSILFITFNITMFLENEDPLNAIVMVSNAFTSNGYAILGDTTWGKISSIILVWSGYILSGAATATLTVAILMRRMKSRIRGYDEKLKDLQVSIDELKAQNKKRDDLQASIDELKK